jgi:hypothetical protein
LRIQQHRKQEYTALLAAFDNARRIFDVNLKEKLQKCKNVHFMHNEKFTNPSIDFISKHFPKGENLFLVHRVVPDSYNAQKFPEGENVIESDYRLLDPKDFVGKKLIFHSLFDSMAVVWLYKNKNLLEHSYWMVWGGDFYNAPPDEANTFVRQNIYGIGCIFDSEPIKQKYGTNHKFFSTHLALSPAPLAPKNIARKIRDKNAPVVIQVNNSADVSTLEILDILAKFKDENIQIRTIVSYGMLGIPNLIPAIINKGKEIFGDKFSYLDKMISAQDYNKYLAQNDILILYQNRQQGVTNLYTSLALGKKVFVKFDTTSAQNIKKWCEIYDSNKIKNMDFNEFCEISEEAILGNIQKITAADSNEGSKIKAFSSVLDDVFVKH